MSVYVCFVSVCAMRSQANCLVQEAKLLEQHTEIFL